MLFFRWVFHGPTRFVQPAAVGWASLNPTRPFRHGWKKNRSGLILLKKYLRISPPWIWGHLFIVSNSHLLLHFFRHLDDLCGVIIRLTCPARYWSLWRIHQNGAWPATSKWRCCAFSSAPNGNIQICHISREYGAGVRAQFFNSHRSTGLQDPQEVALPVTSNGFYSGSRIDKISESGIFGCQILLVVKKLKDTNLS